MHKRMCLLPAILFGFTAVANATVLLPADLPELVAGARAIVHGKITEARVQWIDGRRRIDSFVTIEVTSYFKGDLGRSVMFRVPGGQLGAYRSVIVGAPVLTPGDEVVLFLGARGPSLPYVLGLSQGVFRVVIERQSGLRVVTPPALFARGHEIERVVRGDRSRRPVSLGEFGRRVREMVSGRAAARQREGE